jgi:NAD(P)-dependent dehydrogenase (short-subunit alcohol dehydrogenase family)
MTTSTSLAGAAVAVTGGGNGIGRAVAQRFAREGAKVAVGDIDPAAAQATAEAIGADAIGVELDVSDRASYAAFLQAAQERHGPLGVLVNNAGVDWIGSFHAEPDEVTRREIDVNLVGTITGTKLGLERMLPRRSGHIVNVASGVGRVPLPWSAVYAATKHGIVGLTESLRIEYRDSGVRFSVIQPAQVQTAMIDGQPRSKRLALVTPEEVAEAIFQAVQRNRFEVWVPSSQGVTAKLGNLLPRRAREAVMGAMGVWKIAGETDAAARRSYHERMFGRSQ